MPERVINHLESVEVHEHERHRPTGPPGPVERLFDQVAEQTPIGQPGQRIVVSQPMNLLLGLFALGDVGNDAVEVADSPPGITGCNRAVDRDETRTVTSQKNDFLIAIVTVPVEQSLQLLALFRVGVKHGSGVRHHLPGGVEAEHVGQRLVDVDQALSGYAAVNAFLDVVGDRFQQVLALPPGARHALGDQECTRPGAQQGQQEAGQQQRDGRPRAKRQPWCQPDGNRMREM